MKEGKRSRLLGHVERIEALEERKREIGADIRDAKQTARRDGFDPAIIVTMIRERRMSAVEREEQRALLDIYRAALGMLADTPLGESARRRLTGELPKPPPAPDDDATAAAPSPPRPSPEEVDAARAEGAVAAKEGRPVTTNPHAPGDPRRAAWDEGWCAASGSDGMDVPPAWRRSKPAKGDGKGSAR